MFTVSTNFPGLILCLTSVQCWINYVHVEFRCLIKNAPYFLLTTRGSTSITRIRYGSGSTDIIPTHRMILVSIVNFNAASSVSDEAASIVSYELVVYNHPDDMSLCSVTAISCKSIHATMN